MNILIPLIIVFEIIGGIVLTSPAKKLSKNILSESDKNVRSLAQEQDTPTPDQSPADTPTPISTPEPTQAEPSPTASVTETVSPTAEPTQTQEPTVTEPTSNPSETTSPSLTPEQNQENLSPSPSPMEAELESETDNQKTTINDFNNALQEQESNLSNNMMSNQSASDSLSKENKNELDGENNQVDQAGTPLEKAHLLVQFGDKDVQHMNEDAKDNNLDDVVFHAEKFSYQLDKAIDTIQKLPPDQAEKVKQDVSSLCNNADMTFRQQELLVGEVDSQTIETARGKCLNYLYEQ